jgi:hypothetical protein
MKTLLKAGTIINLPKNATSSSPYLESWQAKGVKRLLLTQAMRANTCYPGEKPTFWCVGMPWDAMPADDLTVRPVEFLLKESSLINLEPTKPEWTPEQRVRSLSKFPNPHTTTLGADPEIFFSAPGIGIIPAWDFLPSKETPIEMEPRKGGYNTNLSGFVPQATVFYDGVQAEFATSPTTCLAFQIDYLRQGLQGALQAAQRRVGKAQFLLRPVVDLPKTFFKDTRPEFAALGCAPSLNVYGVPPLDVCSPETLLIRFAGAHLHFGNVDPKARPLPAACKTIVKALDAYLGILGVSLAENYDDPRRRLFYGKAGEYRTPKHGLEYRVLSNFWLIDPLLAHLVFEVGRKIVLMANWLPLPPADRVQEIINSCDVTGARALLAEHHSLWEKVMFNFTTNARATKRLVGLLSAPLESEFSMDICANWHLNGAIWASHSNNSSKTWNRF